MRATTRFRELLREPGIIVVPGAYDALTAKIVEGEGFSSVYMTGAGTSVARLGYPDLALATMTEMVGAAAVMVSAVDVPVIADADTGYGGVLNVQRTIREYERTGVAAVHIEDQESPKRCGHLDGKSIVAPEEMVWKIRAAFDARTDDDFTIIVRTDALAVTGWDDTLRRCEAYVEAGADVLFVEALQEPDQVAWLARNFDAPLLYNFVETGKSPLLSAPELEQMGFKIVLFPVSALLVVTRAMTRLMHELKENGTTAHLLDDMAGLLECFETVGLSEMLEIDAGYAG